ncbi:hypothetical protein DPMN_156618 [Dreissena polymorpha]|uniref:Uncharacterized protein n=1 Tax=Dreissena polymorpha TaxID=45954 RepID=A0A9D4FRJ7_DREPO|nr:hypothetical protein DPMN_156618 [Dreissena polymorpha]
MEPVMCIPNFKKYKLECANHTCKCLKANLEELVAEKPHLKGKGKLTKLNRVRLTTAVRCAIKMRSSENDPKQLKIDVTNSIYHILGFHDKEDWEKNIDSVEQSTNENGYNDYFNEIIDEQYEFWKLPSHLEMENSRTALNKQCQKEELTEVRVHPINTMIH